MFTKGTTSQITTIHNDKDINKGSSNSNSGIKKIIGNENTNQSTSTDLIRGGLSSVNSSVVNNDNSMEGTAVDTVISEPKVLMSDSKDGSSTLKKVKKPGPQRKACKFCGEAYCSHCRCRGYSLCDHLPGSQCSRTRYNKRLVCNQCERVKLRTKQDQESG